MRIIRRLDMTTRDRIVAYLGGHPEGVDDDALAAALGLTQRQHANQECRRLDQLGRIQRRRVNGKIRNFLTENDESQIAQAESGPEPQLIVTAPEERESGYERLWHWEGNVQATLVRHLMENTYRIIRVAETASRETGKDIVAIAPTGQELWISVKGYPKGTIRTNPATQARHWFAHAFYDLFVWHGDKPEVALALGLPDFPTYRHMSRRVALGLRLIRASLFWVFQDGQVKREEFGPP